VSGYAHPSYERLTEAGWGRVDFETACHAAGRTRTSNLQGTGSSMKHQPRTETVWLDPATTAEREPQLRMCEEVAAS
jgi:hypothetical protein